MDEGRDRPRASKTPASGKTPEAFIRVISPAALWAAIAFGLSFPVLAFRTEQNISNELVLEPRWGLVAIVCGIVFATRVAWDIDERGRREVVAELHRRLSAWAGIASGQALRSAAGRGLMLAGLALMVAYPFLALFLTGSGGAIKWIDNFGIQILIYILLAWGLNIVVGLAGLLDLGYVAFYAVGAYSAALLAKTFGLSFWLCLPMAGLLAAFWGILLGFPVLRLRGDYLAIVTLAFGEIVRLVLVNWVELTGGYAGISGIPRPSFFGLPFNATPDGFAATFGLPFSPLHRLMFLFYLVLALALLTYWITRRLRQLPIGRAWEALREDEIAARALGINTVTTKLAAFAIGAGVGGLAGAFFAARQGFISPESFVFMESATVLAIVVLGGMGSQIGVAIAAVVMIGGTELLRQLDWLKEIFGPSFDPAQYRMLVFGLAIVLLMALRPRGLVTKREPSVFLHKRHAVSGKLVREGHG